MRNVACVVAEEVLEHQQEMNHEALLDIQLLQFHQQPHVVVMRRRAKTH